MNRLECTLRVNAMERADANINKALGSFTTIYYDRQKSIYFRPRMLLFSPDSMVSVGDVRLGVLRNI